MKYVRYRAETFGVLGGEAPLKLKGVRVFKWLRRTLMTLNISSNNSGNHFVLSHHSTKQHVLVTQNVGGTLDIVSPPLSNVGGTCPPVPHPICALDRLV
jgi:hypothetical protein